MRLQSTHLLHSRSSEEEPRVISPGLITRKPERKAPFARKKGVQQDSKNTVLALKEDKEGKYSMKDCPKETLPAAGHKGLKYLSPKHTQSPIIYSTQSTSTILPTPSHPHSYLLRRHTLSPFDDVLDLPLSPTSMELIGKTEEPTDHSRSDWFGLEAQNQRLKQENRVLREERQRLKQLNAQIQQEKRRLQEQVHFLKEELSLFKKPQIPPPSPTQTSKCPKCKNMVTIERLRAENRQLHANLALSMAQANTYRESSIQLQREVRCLREAVNGLEGELDVARQAEQQLEELVGALQRRIERDALQLRYLGVQQDMLMRRREEVERSRQESACKGQRESLKRILKEYKEKVELLKKVMKGRAEQKRMEQAEISLQLSLDSVLSK